MTVHRSLVKHLQIVAEIGIWVLQLDLLVFLRFREICIVVYTYEDILVLTQCLSV